MALNLRAPRSERYAPEADHEPAGGRPLGTAMSEWDREDASRNPAGMAEELYQHSGGWRRWIRGGFGILALAGFAGVLWYAYEWGLGGGETVGLPTVQAEAGPEKEKPSDPGGLQVPYQDQLVLNQGEAGATAPRIERLLPPPEAPLPLPELAEIAPSYDEPVDAAPLDGEIGLPSGDAGALQPAGEPAGEPAETAAELQAAKTVPELPAAPSAQAAQDVAGSQGQAGETQSAATQATTTQATTTPAPTTPAPTTPAATTPATRAAGDFAVQLVSLKDSGAAQQEWSRLQGVFPQLLGDKSLLLQSADVAGVGKVYRLRAGPYATRATAAKVCAQLKSKQQDCLVVNR
jgi:cell division septation protein DedD